MKKRSIPILALAALTLPTLGMLGMQGARAQSFPFEDTFSSYTYGSTGAPAWSVLDGQFSAADGALHGPLTIRYNARPPQRFTLDLTLDLDGAAPTDGWETAIHFDAQHDADTGASDVALLRIRPAEGAARAELVTGSTMPGAPLSRQPAIEVADPGRKQVSLRVVADAETGRYAVLIAGKPIVTSAAAEYGPGLFAIRVGEGVSLDRAILRAPTAEEKRFVVVTSLFDDPRDLADGDNGDLLVLHRGSPAVLTVTPDGEVTRTFGRRTPGGIPDPVALARGIHGEVMVLNRYPGEVVVYERNGGIRQKIGTGRLKEPSDLTVLSDGTLYVADPGAGSVVAFGTGGKWLGAVTSFGQNKGTPVRLAQDAFGSLVVLLSDPGAVVTLRPDPDRAHLAVASAAESAASDILSGEGGLLAYADGAITVWPRAAADAPAFRAASVGGLSPGGRLARVGENVYALDRQRSRIVMVPATLKEAAPSVSFLNLAQSTALVRWTSAQPALESRVRIMRGKTWTTELQRNKTPVTEHQVPVARLRLGQTYRYNVSPTVATIPPTDWSVDYTFETAPGPEAPEPPAAGAAGKAASEKPDEPTAPGATTEPGKAGAR